MLFTAIEPMLLTLKWEAFDDEGYIFEPKWDGWRVLLHKQGEKVEAYTKNGKVITEKFPEAVQAAVAVSLHEAILYCEGICIRGGRLCLTTSHGGDGWAIQGKLSWRHKLTRLLLSLSTCFMTGRIAPPSRS